MFVLPNNTTEELLVISMTLSDSYGKADSHHGVYITDFMEGSLKNH